MQVNPEPLKIVTHRAGEDPPKPLFMVDRIFSQRTGHVRRISVHRDGCPRTPRDCYPKPRSSEWVAVALAKADEHGAEQAISCPVCGGWSVSP
jgi:hypothetical protein